MDDFRALVATPLLALLALIAAFLVVSRRSEAARQIYAGYALFLIIGVAALNLLYLSYDERFGNEFGLFLFGLLPFLVVLSITGVWCAIHFLKSPSLDPPLKPLSAFALVFIVLGMVGALFGWFPPGYDYFVQIYGAVSVALALYWYLYGKHRLSA